MRPVGQVFDPCIGRLIGIESGVPLQHVAYRGSVPAITDVISGQIAATFTPRNDALPNPGLASCA